MIDLTGIFEEKASSLKLRQVLRSTALLCSLLPAGVAYAQPAAPAPVAESKAAPSDIIVTARRRAERLQDVPVAVTAVTGDLLTRSGITNLQQLTAAVPSLQVSPTSLGPTVPGYTLRGQRQLEGVLTQDTSVGVYFADIVQARPDGSNQALYDIASVEVLKGPQGTLFGRNTTGGAILIAPVKPDFTPSGYVTTEVGNYDLVSATGAVNLPLSDSLSIRAAGRATQRSGYTKNIINGQDLDNERSLSGRLGVLWRSGNIESYSMIDFVHYGDNGISYAIDQINPNNPALTGLFPGIGQALTDQQNRGPRIVALDSASPSKLRTITAMNSTEFSLDDIKIKNIFGYRKIKRELGVDFDGTPFPIFSVDSVMDVHQISDELQFTGSAFKDRVKYIAGGYYFRESGLDLEDYVVYGGAPVSRGGYGTNTSKSLFAQADVKLLEGLKFTGGYRYTWDTRAFSFRSQGPGLTTCALLDYNNMPLNPCRKDVSASFGSGTYLLTLSYAPSRNTLFYVTNNTGYRAGGFNIRGVQAEETSLPFKPENVKNYEVGVKTTVLDHLLTFNGALYHSDYTKIQKTVGVPCQTTVVCSFILNAASARIQGGEGELLLRPTSWLKISSFIGYTDAKYTKFLTAAGDFTKNPFSYVPKANYGATLNLSGPLGKLGVGDATLTYFHQSGMQPNELNDSPNIPGYGYANLSFGLADIAGSRLSVRAHINNITNKAYVTAEQAAIGSFGVNAAQFGPPRTYSASVTYTW